MTQKLLRKWMYGRYKAVYPHSLCGFVDTEAFFRFTNEAVDQYEKRKFERPLKRLDEQIAPYKALSLSDLPDVAVHACVRAVTLNPSAKIWLCGSFVKGYALWDGMPQNRRFAAMAYRKHLGMPLNVSDFDFASSSGLTLTPFVIDGYQYKTEQLRCPIGTTEQILIDMYDWDFSKLPKSEHAEVLRLYNERAFAKLVLMHDKYKLSMNAYCCKTEGFMAWWAYAINNGIIS